MFKRAKLLKFQTVPCTNLTLARQNCKDSKKSEDSREILEEPTTCCMSGCANCVWLDYAEKLSKLYKDGGERALKEINEKITDPNMKAFLLHELRMKAQRNNNDTNRN